MTAIAAPGPSSAASTTSRCCEGRSTSIDGRRIAIFRLLDGYAAIDAHCPHAHGPLHDGIVADSCVTCPLHGRRFDLTPARRSTGRNSVDRPRGRGARRGDLGADLPDVKTTCPYCGVGCGLIATVEEGRLTAVRGDKRAPRQPGRDLPQADAPARGRPRPRPRDRADVAGEPGRALADRQLALRHRFDHPQAGRHQARRDRVLHLRPAADRGLLRGQQAGQGLPRHQQRRHATRACACPAAVAGYTAALGSDGPPPSYADIDEAETLLLVGSNAAACHPIVWNADPRAATGAFLIVADPRRTPTAEHADLHLPVRPGTDLPLLNAMLHVLERDGLLDRTFLAAPHARGRGRADDRRRVARPSAPPRRAGSRPRTSSRPPAASAPPSARWRCGRWGSTSRAWARSRTAR